MAESKTPSVEEELRRFSADFKIGKNLLGPSSPTESSTPHTETKTKRAASVAEVEGLKAFHKNFVLGLPQRKSLDLSKDYSGDSLDGHFSSAASTVDPQVRLKQVPDTLSIKKSPLAQERNHVMAASNGTSSGSAKKKKKPPRKRPASLSAPSFEDKYAWMDEVLGEGAFAVVKSCRNISTQEQFAVKVIEKKNAEARSRVLREVEILYKCKGHSNILQLQDYYETNSQFYLIFEKMEGGPLLAHIKRLEHFTEQEASQVVVDITEALKYLHSKGIAHRDLKPENVLCSHSNRTSPAKICDFDLSSVATLPSVPLQRATTPMLYTPVGSAEFMAPEVVETLTGESFSYDKKCDLWSLGVTLYIMLSGYPPFYGRCGNQCGWDEGGECDKCHVMLMERIQDGHYEFPPEQWENVSAEAKDLISHLLVKDVCKRYTAELVLSHPWIQKTAPSTPLDTPLILKRNPSITSELAQYAAHSVAFHRTDSSQTLSRHNSGEIFAGTPAPTGSSPLLLNGSDVATGSSLSVDLETPTNHDDLCLSSPEVSELAHRRAKHKLSNEDCDEEKRVTFKFDESSVASSSPSIN